MIEHIQCDIFESGADVILHQVNCQGVMGSGIAKQVRQKYPLVYESYKAWCNSADFSSELLGMAQIVYPDPSKNFRIINLFAQDKYGYDKRRYTDYDALRKSIEEVFRRTKRDDVIAIPYRMGCDRGGGDWNEVYRIIENVLVDNKVLICEYSGG